MIEAYKEFWKRYVDFVGEGTTRPKYWWVFLVQAIIGVIWGIIFGILAAFGSSNGSINPAAVVWIIIGVLYILAIIIPQWALTARRIKDAGLPWGLVFLNFVPYLGGLVVTIFTLLPTKNTASNQ